VLRSGLLRFARNDGRASIQMQFVLAAAQRKGRLAAAS
jgi:hypothetical protein